MRMTGHSRVLVRPWKLLVGVVLLGAHLIFFHRLRHAGLSLMVMAVFAVLLIAKHVGVFASLYGLLRRSTRK